MTVQHEVFFIFHAIVYTLKVSYLIKSWWCLRTRRHVYTSGRLGTFSRVVGQKQTLQCMAGRNNFPPTIPFLLLLLDLGNLWNFNQINSWFSQSLTKAVA